MFVFPATVSSNRRTLDRAATDRAWSQAFDHLFDAPRTAPATASPRVPALDVTETDAAYTLSFELPGVTREQLKVAVLGRRVELSTTEAEAPALPEGTRQLYRERSQPAYARTVSLPSEVDATATSAKLDNGVLTLTLAKKVPTGATQVQIG